MALMSINNLLDLIIAAHENTRPVMNVLGHYREHPVHAAVD